MAVWVRDERKKDYKGLYRRNQMEASPRLFSQGTNDQAFDRATDTPILCVEETTDPFPFPPKNEMKKNKNPQFFSLALGIDQLEVTPASS